MALLAILVLLACHGALGSLHLVLHGDASDAGNSGSAIAASEAQVVVAGAGEAEASLSGSLKLPGYAAVSLVLLSAAIWLILGVFGRRTYPAAPRQGARTLVPTRRPVFIRRSDPPLLQVFRL